MVFGAQEMFHVDRLTGSKQRPIEYGMRSHVDRVPSLRQMKAPRLDSIAPA
jgi:hypothetical protein